MTDQELRDALREYAAPATPPPGGRDQVLARVATHQRRFRVSAGVAAAAAVAVVIAGGLMLRPGAQDEPEVEPLSPRKVSSEPVSATPCSDDVFADQDTQLGPLTDVASIRLCVEHGQEPRDALVGGFDTLAEAFRKLRVADPARCALVNMAVTRDRVVVTRTDGTHWSVAAGFCQDVARGAGRVDGLDVLNAFLVALDRQRDKLSYPMNLDDPPLGCADSAGVPGPVRPDRERFVKAALCTQAGTRFEPRELTAGKRDRLNAAWRKADGAVYHFDVEGKARCHNNSGGSPFVVALTDRGDVVSLTPDSCRGDLVFYPFQEMPLSSLTHLDLPIGLDELR